LHTVSSTTPGIREYFVVSYHPRHACPGVCGSFRRVSRWVSPAEWIFEQIFGVRACSHSMASGTGLYDFARRDWDEELLEVCGLTRPQLNPLRDEVDGGDGLTVYPAVGDGAASNLGSGASTRGFVAINVGTSAAVRAIH